MPRISLNLTQFQKEVPNLSKRLVEKVISDAKVQLTKVLFESVVQTTPVLTGQARNNWNIGVGAKPEGSVLGGTGVEVTGEGPTPEERVKINQATKDIRSQSLREKVWITNRLGYVKELDEGSSTKAPSGIRAVAVERALSAKLKGVGSMRDNESE